MIHKHVNMPNEMAADAGSKDAFIKEFKGHWNMIDEDDLSILYEGAMNELKQVEKEPEPVKKGK